MTGAVLWDLDGTLVDSEEQHWRAWRDTMTAEGLPLTYEQFRSTFGRRNDSFLPEWLGPAATPERVVRVADAKEACYRRLVRENGLTPLPGAVEWVRRLRDEGWKQAVASSAPALNVEAMLDASGLKEFFQATAAAEDVRVGKPDPEVFLVAAARVGAKARRCIVVEDAAAGLEGARRAGMRSIGVNRGAALDADIVVPSLEALPADAFTRLLRAQKSDASKS
jgi:HAD superfamily hydrolase (TIGR01509 family)